MWISEIENIIAKSRVQCFYKEPYYNGKRTLLASCFSAASCSQYMRGAASADDGSFHSKENDRHDFTCPENTVIGLTTTLKNLQVV